MNRICLILLLASSTLTAQMAYPEVRNLLTRNARVHWGVHAVQLKTGRVLYSANAEQFFIPASNMKLFSTALALTALGAEHRFSTTVLSAAGPDSEGLIVGDLVLRGGGDPSLSARRYPYDRENPFGEDRLEPLRQLARQLKDRGVRTVTGRVVGDDSLDEFDLIPNGWAADDGVFESGAPVSALSFNDNVFGLKLSSRGISLDPPVEYFELLNEVAEDPTGARRVRVERLPGSRVLRLFGNLPGTAKDYANDFAVDDPALYAAACFRKVLIDMGIRVDGEAEARHVAPVSLEPVELARRDSVALPELLRVTDKVSQNLHAELMLRAAKKAMSMSEFLKGVGIDEKDVNFEDGSGMSRLALVTPKAVVQLLQFMGKQNTYEMFRSFLPVGAEDGTLRNRFDKNAKAKAIRAKTGSLSHVSALGGYADSKRYGPVAFQIVANNYNITSQEVRAIIDRIALALLQ